MPGAYRITVSHSIIKSLNRIPMPWRRRIEIVIDSLKENPYAGIKMNGDLKDKRKLRVWPYRVVYKILPDQRLID